MVYGLFFIYLHHFSYISVCRALVAMAQTRAETIHQLKIIITVTCPHLVVPVSQMYGSVATIYPISHNIKHTQHTDSSSQQHW